MVGPTLIDIRERVEELAVDGGRFYVVCGRTGDRPVPAAGNRFPDRTAARAAAGATEQYRSALRRYDPRVPYYDLIVCQEADEGATGRHVPGGAGRASTGTGTGTGTGAGAAPPDRRGLIEFCHRAAGAVFETLSDAGHDDAERAVMDAYFGLAERVEGPDELCLALLEGMATELHARLSPGERAAVLADAAGRLEPAGPTAADPLPATLSALERRGLIEGYTRARGAGGARTAVVSVSGYALSPREGRLPVLPLVLELFRHDPDRRPPTVRASGAEDGWRLRVGRSGAADPDGLASAPIEEGA